MIFHSYIGEDTCVEVEVDIEPGESPVYYPNDLAHPGCDPELEIISVKMGKDELIEHLNEACITHLEEEAWKHIEELEE